MESYRKKYTEERPWGYFERFTFNETSTVKILTIKPGEHPSLQYHQKREEFWLVIKGNAIVKVGNKKTHAEEGNEFFIPKKAVHCVEAVNDEAKILEISFGEFDEKDIVRLKDKYGRA